MRERTPEPVTLFETPLEEMDDNNLDLAIEHWQAGVGITLGLGHDERCTLDQLLNEYERRERNSDRGS